MALPNPVQASASITAGWLNKSSVAPGQTNNFAGGYAGGATGAYGLFGGGVMFSPGNGTATILGIDGGVSAGKNTSVALAADIAVIKARLEWGGNYGWHSWIST